MHFDHDVHRYREMTAELPAPWRGSLGKIPAFPSAGAPGKEQIIRFVETVLIALGAYLAVTFLILPSLMRHPAPDPSLTPGIPLVTHKANGIPGDPVNIALVGTWDEVMNAMAVAGWYPSDRLALMSAVREVGSVLVHRQYQRAPVSNLYLWFRREDMAFEKQAAKSPQKRHHVRFWLSWQPWKDGRQMWVGAATFDRSVGFSHYTAQVTHHIDPGVDLERDTIIEDIRKTGGLEGTCLLPGIGPTTVGKNGEGDAYFTDGNIRVGILKAQENQKGNE